MICQTESLPLDRLNLEQLGPIALTILFIIAMFLFYMYKKEKITKGIIEKVIDKLK